MVEKNTCCSYCGAMFEPDIEWPRKCNTCGSVSFSNPVPVVVAVQPVYDGLLTIRRGIGPGKGELALPGGYIDSEEPWQVALCRELHEETGLVRDPDVVQLFDVRSGIESDTILVFGLLPHMRGDALPAFEPSEEATERVILLEPQELAFNLHTEVVRQWWHGKTGSSSVEAPLLGTGASVG